MLSLAYLGELIAKAREGTAGAGEEELLQVRSDCRAIAALAAAVEAVDWNNVSRTLDKNAAFLALTSTEPLSYRARRAERHAQRKNQLQPKIIRMHFPRLLHLAHVANANTPPFDRARCVVALNHSSKHLR